MCVTDVTFLEHLELLVNLAILLDLALQLFLEPLADQPLSIDLRLEDLEIALQFATRPERVVLGLEMMALEELDLGLGHDARLGLQEAIELVGVVALGGLAH